MNTKANAKKRKELIHKIDCIKNMGVYDFNRSQFKRIYDLFMDFFILHEGVVIPAIIYENGSMVELSVVEGMTFLEEQLISDFIKNRLDSVKFIDWIQKSSLKRAFSSAVKKIENPK